MGRWVDLDLSEASERACRMARLLLYYIPNWLVDCEVICLLHACLPACLSEKHCFQSVVMPTRLKEWPGVFICD